MSATDVGEGLVRVIRGGGSIFEVATTPKAAASAKATRATAVTAVRVGEAEVLLFFFAGDDEDAMAVFSRGEAGRFLRIAATMPASSQSLSNSCVGAAILSPPSPLMMQPISTRSRIASLKWLLLFGSGDGAAREGMVVGMDRWCQLR